MAKYGLPKNNGLFFVQIIINNDMDKSDNIQPELADLISLSEATRISGLSQGHLSLLIRNGDLWGSKIGGRNWFTTKKAIEEYLGRHPKPGPKPKLRS